MQMFFFYQRVGNRLLPAVHCSCAESDPRELWRSSTRGKRRTDDGPHWHLLHHLLHHCGDRHADGRDDPGLHPDDHHPGHDHDHAQLRDPDHCPPDQAA